MSKDCLRTSFVLEDRELLLYWKICIICFSAFYYISDSILNSFFLKLRDMLN